SGDVDRRAHRRVRAARRRHAGRSRARTRDARSNKEENMSAKTNTIAFQGEAGANSHLACREVFPQMTAMPCQTFEDVFAAVKEKKARLAMIPIENSLHGRITDIHHLLPDS